MKHIIFSAALIFFMVCATVVAGEPPPGAPTVSHPDAYKGLTKEGIAKIKAGEIIILKKIKQEESASGMVEAALIYNQPIDKTWRLIVDRVEDQRKFLPHLDTSKVVARKGNRQTVNFHLSILGIDLNWYVEHEAEKDKYYFHWNLNEKYKSKIRSQKGYWKFFWIDENRTLARYGTWFSFAIPIPRFVQSFLIKRDLPKSLGNMKKFIDSGGTWRKSGYKGN